VRTMILLASIIATGCAARPGFNYDPAQGFPLNNTSPQNPSYIEAQRLATVKNLNLHIVTMDGERSLVVDAVTKFLLRHAGWPDGR